MDTLSFHRLKQLCIASGFTQKGKTFFRLVGDGVLQVIKCKYQRNIGADLISVGLFSMYSDLQPQWLTASGCIPRYSILSCFHGTLTPVTFAIPINTQLDMLESQVLPWLNSIDTQKKLIRAITQLDSRWNDRLKIGPYLACGELHHAKKVLREILASHDFGNLQSRKLYEDPSGMLYLKKEQIAESPQVLLDMISRGSADEIHAYLKTSYARNLEYAAFCVKGTKNH